MNITTLRLDDLWPHQREAVSASLRALGDADRAQVHMACGSGKTRVAGRLMTSFGGPITVWLCPTIELMLQTYNRTRSELTTHKRLLVAYSKRDQLDDGTPITNDVDGMKAAIGKKTLIFCTYASFPHLDETLWGLGRKVDLLIADEAHKTVGGRDALYARWLHPRAEIEKRLAMTATPRIITCSEGRAECVSMDDQVSFGGVAYRYSFEQAVADGVVCGVEALVPIVTGDPSGLEARYQAIKLAKEHYSLKRIMTFHGTVRDARRFSKYLNERGVESFHVNGRTPRMEIEKVRRRLDSDLPVVVTNARLFGEGIDVPALDAVFFCDFKSSLVDVTQQIGRAVRQRPGKKKGYVILPASNRIDIENVLRGGRFGRLWQLMSEVLDATETRARGHISESKCRIALLGGEFEDSQVFEASLEKLVILRKIEVGRHTWFAKSLAVMEWLDAGKLPYQHDSPFKEWISENTRALRQGLLTGEQFEIMQRICLAIEGKDDCRYHEALAYVESLENGGPRILKQTIVIRNNRKKAKYACLYERMMAVRNAADSARHLKRLQFLDQYERGLVCDRSMYAQFVRGVGEPKLDMRFRQLHEKRLSNIETGRLARQQEAVRRYRIGEDAKVIAQELGVTPSSIWYWNRNTKHENDDET